MFLIRRQAKQVNMPKLCFAFLTQNSSTYLQRNVNWIRACAQQYDDYRVVFVENDSIDNTVDILNATMLADPCFSGEMMIDHIGNSEDLCTRDYNCPRRLQRTGRLASTVADTSSGMERIGLHYHA